MISDIWLDLWLMESTSVGSLYVWSEFTSTRIFGKDPTWHLHQKKSRNIHHLASSWAAPTFTTRLFTASIPIHTKHLRLGSTRPRTTHVSHCCDGRPNGKKQHFALLTTAGRSEGWKANSESSWAVCFYRFEVWNLEKHFEINCY